MHRTFVLLVLVATAACGPAPPTLSPVAAPTVLERVVVTPEARPAVTYHLQGPSLGWSEGMPVLVPDIRRLEPMPVVRPDTTIDRGMVTRGNAFRWRLRGPAKVVPDSSSRRVP